ALAEADAVVVFFPGPGRESWLEPGDTGDPWSNYVDLAPPVEGFRGAGIVNAAPYHHPSRFGALCHGFGTLLRRPQPHGPRGALERGGWGGGRDGEGGVHGAGHVGRARERAAAHGSVVQAPSRLGRRARDRSDDARRAPAGRDGSAARAQDSGGAEQAGRVLS